MRTFKIAILSLLTVVGIAGAGAGLYAAGYSYGYNEVAYADPVAVPGPGAVPLMLDAGLPVAVADAPAVAPPTAVASSGPCIDMDGPAGPAPCVSDPLKQPGASLDTAAAAKRLGWPLLVFVVLFFGAVMAGELVPALKRGRVALFMAGGTTALAAAVNAGFDGGSWLAMASAAGAVLLTMVQGNRTVAELVKGMQPKAGG